MSMRCNRDIVLKQGQRWKWGKCFIGEIVSFTDRDNVNLKVVQSINGCFSVGRVVCHTLDDPSYVFLEGQEAS